MTVGGQGIPRLQELAYLETVATAVKRGCNFEEIRLAIVEHVWANAQNAPETELPELATYRQWRSDEKKFVRNVTDALKELMRLGFAKAAQLPSSGRSAYAHRESTYKLTSTGEEWIEVLESDRRNAYDTLVPHLIQHHPGFACFLTVVGVLGDDVERTFVVPLLRWGQLPRGQRSYTTYRSSIGDYVAVALASSDLGWSATASEIRDSVSHYLDRVLARAEARERDPFPTVRAFIQTCEEALVKLAFSKAGCSLDYISVEIARRWSRWLGLASFTYYAPGPHALRFWHTSQINLSNREKPIARHTGGQWRDRALDALYEYCQQTRAAGTTYIPVWEARAAVCWRLRIVDDEFDRAITDMIAGGRAQDRSWRVHLDQVSIGSTPSSAAPFVLKTASTGVRKYNVLTVVPKLTQ